MTDIVVIRGMGDREGDDITEILLSTDAAALSRGRAELDLRSSAQVSRSIRIPFENGFELGQTVRVQDALQGETYVGKITGLSISFINAPAPSAVIDMDLIVPTNFYG